MSRPGVPMTASTPLRSAAIWRSIDAPPYTAATLRPRRLPSGASTFFTWFASSRVGVRTSARGAFGSARPMRSSSGRPKARVLPDPVFALPHRSRPARASGIVSAWMGNGSVMPSRASAATRSPATPSVSNVDDKGKLAFVVPVLHCTRRTLRRWVSSDPCANRERKR
jgi:hypothetical protein